MKRAIAPARGFTMVELVTVMVLLGVLAAIGVPRLMDGNGTRAAVFGDQVASALRLAQKNAVARRRVVCAEAQGTAVRLRIRTTPGPGACDDVSIDGITDDLFASGAADVTVTGAPAVLFFQPDGTISAAEDGTPLGRQELFIKAAATIERTIVLAGSTGHVE